MDVHEAVCVRTTNMVQTHSPALVGERLYSYGDSWQLFFL